ncbi:site-specific DNA-methyltransferase [Planctomycetales bacterium]|nr:site-specific DNA-methyltransferase [Planctomycetales bacterium]GHS98852.1 site-specific DNA-methyltransferase [Planctomycetales bacterium]GHT07355.1 site-specific DNA-methyltransferase [Planctomycetales bacterium]
MAKQKPAAPTPIAAFTHDDKRKNIPTAELQAVVADDSPWRVAFARRNRDLDPQLVWRGKDDGADFAVGAPPLYIQEKIHPKALIDDLRRDAVNRAATAAAPQISLFADFNGIPVGIDKTEFYAHDQNWTNRMILGDSLQVMGSLAEREGLRGKVQCVYFDPPYGIKFNSNFQWSTTSRDVKDGNAAHITREPEQVKAFRDTWRDGIHSYLSYIRDRLVVARDLLTDSGSIFVQIGDENVHRVRAVMDEVFGDDNFVAQITTKTSGGSTGVYLAGVLDYVLWYAKDAGHTKYRPIFGTKEIGEDGADKYTRIRFQNLETRILSSSERNLEEKIPHDAKVYRQDNLTSQSVGRDKGEGAASWFPVNIEGKEIRPSIKVRWKTNELGMQRLLAASRIEITGNSLAYVRFLDDFSATTISNSWNDIGGIQSRSDPKVYVVQTPTTLIQRCILMTTDPGDLVLDPTCGSGTTATVAEQWGRRWITIDTSRVALALARARLMGARYPYYLLADSAEGRQKEAELSGRVYAEKPTYDKVRQGFVYERVPHITLKSIANNAEIDVIYEKYQAQLESLREQLNRALKQNWQEWEIPREIDADIPSWLTSALQEKITANLIDRKAAVEQIKNIHANWWKLRLARQKEIDASITAQAEYEYLYDQPYEDKKKVRVAGPFTVESISPHRTLGVDENGDVIENAKCAEPDANYGIDVHDFAALILENLKTAGVQQAHKADKIEFASLEPWPGRLICAVGIISPQINAGNENSPRITRIDADKETEKEIRENSRSSADKLSADNEKRVGIFIGPEFGTVSRADLVAAAREGAEAGFDALIACAFNYEAHTTEFENLGKIRVLKARMNADLHMAGDLSNTGKGNLFVIFGEPDIAIIPDGADQICVKINGVDVFHPTTGEIRSDGPEGIACWFIDTDYNNESFFVRHAYFLGANDPYDALKRTLKADINAEAWETLHRDISRPFTKPTTGLIAVKVINHLGDEALKVFKV